MHFFNLKRTKVNSSKYSMNFVRDQMWADFIIYEGIKPLRKKGKKNFRFSIRWLIKKYVSLFIFRIFWIIIPLVMLAFASVLIHLLAEVYFENAFIMNQAKPLFTSQTGFPAITICPNEAILPAKVTRLVEK